MRSPQLSFLAIGIASVIATAVIVSMVNLINRYGHEIGLVATKGHLFLGMTWAATVPMLLLICMSIFQCVG